MKIVFLEPLGVSMDQLRKQAKETIGNRGEVICYENRVEDINTLIERSREADVVVLSNFRYTQEVMKECPNLKLVCVAFTGVDHVDLEYCRNNNIMVCNAAGYSTVAVADLVFGFAIALTRNILPCHRVVRQGGTKDGLVGWELEGKTFGIVGLGAIGQRVAKIADAFGCKVIAYNRSKKDIQGIEQVEMEELLERSDIVSLHIPFTAETKGFIGKQELQKMKSSGYLINTARGGVVDADALAEAVKNGGIAGAAVDVFDIEPPLPVENPLLNIDGIIATPHIAFASKQAFEKRAHIVMDNIDAWLKQEPKNIV